VKAEEERAGFFRGHPKILLLTQDRSRGEACLAPTVEAKKCRGAPALIPLRPGVADATLGGWSREWMEGVPTPGLQRGARACW
jgi:hypothetical protein